MTAAASVTASITIDRGTAELLKRWGVVLRSADDPLKFIERVSKISKALSYLQEMSAKRSSLLGKEIRLIIPNNEEVAVTLTQEFLDCSLLPCITPRGDKFVLVSTSYFNFRVPSFSVSGRTMQFTLSNDLVVDPASEREYTGLTGINYAALGFVSGPPQKYWDLAAPSYRFMSNMYFNIEPTLKGLKCLSSLL